MPPFGEAGGRPTHLDDDVLDTSIAIDDDLEIVLIDDDENEKPLRGQNEDEGLLDDAEPRDHDDSRFQERLSAERRRTEEIERSALEAQERTEYQLLQAEKRNIATQRDSFRLALDGVDVRIATTTEALKYARQEGDVSAETDLEAKLAELRNIRNQIDVNLSRLPDERNLDAQFEQHINARRSKYAASRKEADEPRALNPKAGEWQKANRWMSDPSRTKERAALMEVNNSLAAEGYDPNSDDFFNEMSRRLAKRFPDLGVRTLKQQAVGQQPRPANPSRSAPPVAPARSSAPPPANGRPRSKVSLDASDVSMMRMLRIDPSDKVAVSRYAAEKHKRLLAENRR